MEIKITSRKTYLYVYLTLLALLGLTIGAGYIDLGVLGPVVALVIAATKALLVIWYFMHVRFSGQLTRIFALLGFVWLSILIGLTLTDYLTRFVELYSVR